MRALSRHFAEQTTGSARPLPDLTAHRLAALENTVDNLRSAMREVAKKESLHPSVRFLADTIALNLAAPTEVDRG